MGKKSQEHPYIPALNGEVLLTKHDKLLQTESQRRCKTTWKNICEIEKQHPELSTQLWVIEP